MKEVFFVGVLKVSDEKSRNRIRTNITLLISTKKHLDTLMMQKIHKREKGSDF
jgi:hypothetical protein